VGKVISIIGGTAAIVVGVVLMVVWNKAFILGLEFLAIFILVLGGLIAVIAGVSEIKDALAAKKEEKKEENK
jgi:multisubunit Na+/H+ antiporter MnhG subunit